MITRRLDTFVARSLRYALRTLQWLHQSPARWDEPVAGHPSVCFLEKVHSEAALLALLSKRALDSERIVSKESEELIKKVSSLLGDGIFPRRALERVLRLPHLSPAFALPIRLRELLGDASENESWLLRGALQYPLVEGLERYPFRRLDTAWIKEQFALDNRLHDLSLESSTCLACPVHPIYASLTDSYALTHAIFYKADFGRKPLIERSGSATTIAATLAAVAAHALSDGDFDLLGEVVMSAASLQLRPDWTFDLAQIVLEVWDKLGHVPDRDFEHVLAYGTTSQADRADYVVRATYHPTFVAGMMCCTLVESEGKENVDDVPPVACAPCESAVLDRFSTLEGPSPPLRPMAKWALGLPEVRDIVRGGPVASLIADAVLTRACRRYDLDTLVEALEMAAENQWELPSMKAATEFLTRQRIEGNWYGAHFLNPENREAVGSSAFASATAERIQSLERRILDDSARFGGMTTRS